MGTFSVDGQSFDLVADSMVNQNTWVVQVDPEHAGYFAGIQGDEKQFTLDDDGKLEMTGYVLKSETHTHNTANKNAPQLQLQVNRKGW